MFNTAIRSATVLVLSFSREQAHVAYITGKGHRPSTPNRKKIKKRFTDANATQKASAFG